MESSEKRQLRIVLLAIRAAYDALMTRDVDCLLAIRVLEKAMEAAAREEEWITLGDLEAGSLFTRAEGGLYLKRAAFKDYTYPCVGVGDGVMHHFCPSIRVREIQAPVID